MALINVPYFFLTGEGFYLVLVCSTYVSLMPRPAEIISRGWEQQPIPTVSMFPKGVGQESDLPICILSVKYQIVENSKCTDYQ